MRVSYLRVLQPSESFKLTGLSKVAETFGHKLTIVRSDPSSEARIAAWQSLHEDLQESDAFVVSDDTLLYDKTMAQTLHARIDSGARVLMLLEENCLELQNSFLAPYDLAGTRIRVRSRTSPLVKFDRAGGSLRDFRLFAGVETVSAQQPNAIWYGGESLPVLVRAEDVVVSDGLTDLPANWNARELASMAAWHSANGGGVLAISGNYFADPYVGATGIEWPGICLLYTSDAADE